MVVQYLHGGGGSSRAAGRAPGQGRDGGHWVQHAQDLPPLLQHMLKSLQHEAHQAASCHIPGKGQLQSSTHCVLGVPPHQ